MTRPVELVVFDCDGVLVDSEKIAVRIDQEVLAELGWHLTIPEIVHRFVGRSGAHFRAEVEDHLGRALPADWEESFRQRYREAFERDLVAVDGITEALDGIDVPVCVASSGSHEKIRHSLELTGLLPRFGEHLFSATEVENGKPAPDLFLHAAASMGIAPERCAVIEDSRFGVQGARAAGMRVFGYCGGLTPAEWLEGPDTVVFDDMARLPELLQASERA